MTIERLDERVDKLASAFRWLIFAISVFFTVALFAVFWQSYDGRRALERSSRKRCDAMTIERIAARDESLAQHRANLLAASDLARTLHARRAFTAQARVNERAAEVRDRSIPRAQRRTAAGRRAPEFSCATAYPDASPWPWSQK